MSLCKFLHKLQNAYQTSQPESGGSGPTQRGFQVSVHSHQQSSDTTPIHLHSMSPQRRPYVPYRQPLPDPPDFRQAASSSQNPLKPSRPPRPLVDLSSLEGPPIDDKRNSSTRNTTIPRIRVDHAVPHNAPRNPLGRPLPPRPASTEPTSQRQQPIPGRPYSQTNRSGTHIRSDNICTQSPAQRGRSIHIEEQRQKSRLSPGSARPTSTSTTIPRQTQYSRSKSLDSIVWHESKGQWVVVDSSATLSSQSQIHCLPTRLRNATSPTPERHRNRNEVKDHDPPDYESHGFSPTHVMGLTFGPASRTRASEREIHNLSTMGHRLY